MVKDAESKMKNNKDFCPAIGIAGSGRLAINIIAAIKMSMRLRTSPESIIFTSASPFRAINKRIFIFIRINFQLDLVRCARIVDTGDCSLIIC